MVVARYTWRHDAEFAAGFLHDAGIPHRLQIDDPALGIPVSMAATLWVLGADEARAREILDITDEHTPQLSASSSGHHRAAPRGGHRPTAADAGRDRGITSAHTTTRPEHRRGKTTLTFRARVLALLAGAGLAGAGRAGEALPSTPELGAAILVVASGLILIGVVGRAPRFLRETLEGLSGSAP